MKKTGSVSGWTGVATIRDVAGAAGVSTATVSHVVSGARFVSEETRGRVLNAIMQLGYQPSSIARAMVTKRSKTIAYLAADLTNPFFAEVGAGAEMNARELGYNVFFCDADDRFAASQSYVNLLREKRIDGLLDFSAVAETPVSVAMPTVLFEKTSPRETSCSIVIDTVGGAHQAVEHLVSLGHRRIAFISGNVQDQTDRNRLIGYQKTLEEHELCFDESLLFEGHHTPESGYEGARSLLDRPDRPTAVFASNDLMAMGAILAIHELGLRIPQDVSVVGFDDLAISRFTHPPLTTVSFPKYEMGRMAVDMLVGMTRAKTVPKVTDIATELVIRDSSGPCR